MGLIKMKCGIKWIDQSSWVGDKGQDWGYVASADKGNRFTIYVGRYAQPSNKFTLVQGDRPMSPNVPRRYVKARTLESAKAKACGLMTGWDPTREENAKRAAGKTPDRQRRLLASRQARGRVHPRRR